MPTSHRGAEMGTGKTVKRNGRKIARKQRFLQAGVWERFVERREALKADGHSAREAAEIAAAECERLMESGARAASSTAVPAETPAPGDAIDPSLFERQSRDFLEIVWFVFDHLDNPSVRPDDAPSGGAWSYLQYLRKHPDAVASFYQDFWKLAPSRAQLDEMQRSDGDGDRLNLERIDEALRKAEGYDLDEV